MSSAPEKDKLIAGEYDGIREYDNPIPLWLNLIFVGTVVFSVIYVVYYHVLDAGQLPLQAYAAEVEAYEALRAEKQAAASHVDLAAVAADPAARAAGREIYVTYCAACHLPDGTGQIGPNLTDAEWIHGGELADIVATIDAGVLDKGMPAWGSVLGPEKVRLVAVYVQSLSSGGAAVSAP